MPNDHLYTVAQEILATAIDILNDASIDVPDRTFVTFGEVADDCLPGNAQVLTPNGPVRIDAMQGGETVFGITEEGQLVPSKVLAMQCKGEKPLWKVRTHRRTLFATDNHKVLILRGEHRKGFETVWSRQWVAVKDLVLGDLLVTLDHLDSPTTNDNSRSLEEAWLWGLMVADGTIDKHSQRSFHICKFGAVREKALDFAKEVWDIEGRLCASAGMRFHSVKVTRSLIEAGFGAKSPDRLIPAEVWEWPPKLQQAFLDGYSEGDGCAFPNRIRYALSNRPLAEQLRHLHMMLGHSVSNIRTYERKKSPTIRGKVVKVALPLTYFEVFNKEPSQALTRYSGYRRGLSDPQLSGQRILTIEPVQSEMTYDIQVEGTNSFVADGVVVHNCDLLAVSWQGTYTGEPGQPNNVPEGQGFVTRSTTFELRRIRCVSVNSANGTPPSPEEMNEDAEAVMTDIWTLYQGFVARKGDRTFLTACEGFAIGNVIPVGPTGGMGGGIIPLEVQVL